MAMTIRRGLAVVFLGVAVPASAVVEARLTAGVRPAFPLSLSAAAVALPAPAPLLSAPLPAESSLPPVQVQVRAAALSGALAEFGRTDLKEASSTEVRDAGDSLMRRALGEDADGAASVLAAPSDSPAPPLALPKRASRPAEHRIYLLSRPLHEKVHLGPLSIAFHLTWSISSEVIQALFIWKATGSWVAPATTLLLGLPWSPASIMGRTSVDLGLRYWRRKLAVLRELARTPGVERLRVLTTGDLEFLGPIARRKDNTGLIFVEASAELPREFGRFGTPIHIADIDTHHVRMTLVGAQQRAETDWTRSLSGMLEGWPIPEETAAAWRAEHKRLRSAGAKTAHFRVEADLVGPDGQSRPLGAIIHGPAVKTLIGLGLLDRMLAGLGRGRLSRRISISDTVVERPGDFAEPGWRAALRRAWRRISGRLIVVKP